MSDEGEGMAGADRSRRRFEANVDPGGNLTPVERARRAKIAYRAIMRSIAGKSVKARAAKKARKEAALRRQLARPPTEREMAARRPFSDEDRINGFERLQRSH